MDAFSPPSVSQPYLVNYVRRTVSSSRPIFDLLLYAPSHTHDAQYANALLRLLSAITIGAKELSYFGELASYMKYKLLLRRIQVGPQPYWDSVDEKLCEIYRSPSRVTSNVGEVQSIVNSLPSETWGDAGAPLRALVSVYLVASIPHLPEPALRDLREIFSSEHAIEEYGDVHETLRPSTEIGPYGRRAQFIDRKSETSGQDPYPEYNRTCRPRLDGRRRYLVRSRLSCESYGVGGSSP
ncbi:hypothetical protein QCA50_000879 [Cerrena zonata]|uniref:Uncharacterized protein n=1 Tax=Cerrena zonata TaxID=2478898 RepID=A0AAW0H0I2_9APHY